jgi:type I restriction enzyme M protein
MLSVAEEYLHELNPEVRLEVFGQEINPESYAICKSDMLIKGQNPANIKFGNTFTVDGLEHEKFDYMLSNPPFGVEWRKAEKIIKAEYEKRGFAGRFGAGLPRFFRAVRAEERVKSAIGSSRMTCWRRSLPCPINFFTIPALPPMF